MRETRHISPPMIAIAGEKKAGEKPAGLLGRLLESDWLAGMVSCVLVATGLCVTVFRHTEFAGGYFLCLGYCLLAAMPFCAGRLRRWIPFAAFGVALLANILPRWYLGTLGGWAEYWLGFFRWAFSGARYVELYSDSPAHPLLQFMIVFLIFAGAWLFSRLAALYPALILLAVSAPVVSLVIEPGDVTLPLLACCIGAITLLPGVFAKSLRRRGEAVSLARMQFIALPAAILAVTLTLGVVPEDTSGWRSSGLNNMLADIGMMIEGPFSGIPGGDSNFSIAELGFAGAGERLGGPVTLSDRLALTVTSPLPVLLKAKAFGVYTGAAWTLSSFDGDMRFESYLMRDYRREAFDQDRPLGGQEARALYESLSREVQIELLYENADYTTLFTAGRPSGLWMDSRLRNSNPFYNLRGELYLHERIPEKHRFRQQTRVWDRSVPDFDDRFLELEALLANVRDERFAVMWSRYGGLPEYFPQRTQRLAESIAKDAESPFQKALALSKWLRESCKYTLKPEIPPPDEDFVTHFLETMHGHCVYYSSALAVMARCVGIPSRYVVGFALERGDGENLYRATAATAHAWTELYFNGIGWIELDPLSWDAEAPLNRDALLASGGYGVMPIMYEPPIQEPQFGTAGALGLTGRGEPLPAEVRAALLLAGAAAAFAAWKASVRLALTRQARRFALARILRKTKGAFPALDAYNKDIVKQLGLLGLKASPGETLRAFSQRADRLVKIDGAAYTGVADALSDYWFAGKEPSEKQIEAACRYHGALEARLFAELGKWPYIAKRGLR